MGRNFFSLVVLTPGVIGRATGGGQAYAQSNSDLYNNEFGVNMNANGARAESNNFLVDSSTVSSSQRSGVVNINPNSESVQEVRVAVNNFSAEYGRNGSVLVNVITKSGSQRASTAVRRPTTRTTRCRRRTTSRSRPPGFRHPGLRRTEVSWGVGGPIKRDRTFFFTSGDVLRSDVAVSGARDHPDAGLHPVHGAGPAEQRLDVHREKLPRLVRARPQLPHRGPAPRRRPAAARTPIASPIGPVPCNLPVTRRGHVERDVAAQRPPVDGACRPHFERAATTGIYGSFNRTTTDKVGFGTPEVYPGFHRRVADQQHALQHQLDADRLADDRQRGVVLVGAAVGRAAQPAPRHPGRQRHRHRELSGRAGVRTSSCRTASNGATS